MTEASTAIRLATSGKAEVKNDFAEVQAAGTAAMAAIADASEKAADQSESAADRAAARQEASYRRMAAAAKVAAVAGVNQDAFNGALGASGSQQFATVNLDRSIGAARDAAAAFEAQFRAEDETAAAAAKLHAVLDPLWAAQERYDAELRSANSLLAQGAIDETLHAKAVAASTARLREAEDAAEGLGGAHRGLGASGMIAEHAVRSFSDSIVAGQNPVQALAMEVPRLAEALQFMAVESNATEGALGKFAAIMSGGWGLAITAGISLVSILGPELYKMVTASDAATDATKSNEDAIRDLAAAEGKEIQTKEQAIQASVFAAAKMLVEEGETRKLTIAKLQLAEANLAQSRSALGASGGELQHNRADPGVSGIVDAETQIASLTKQIDTQNAAIKVAAVNYRNAKFDRTAFFAAGDTDKSTAAAQAYDRASAHLRQEFDAGRISQAQVKTGLDAAAAARDAATASAGRHGRAVNEEAKAEREAAKEARELRASLADLVKIDPADAATAKYRKQIEEIARLEKAGMTRGGIDTPQADNYRLEALKAWSTAEIAAEDQAREKLLATLGPAIRDGSKSLADSIDLSKQVDFIGLLPSKQIDEQKKNVEKLASTFQSAFDGGTSSIWERFKEEGEHVIAELIAKWVAAHLGDASGNVSFGSITGAIGGLFGHGGTNADSFLASSLGHNAAGTEYWSGGMSWVGENGPELVRMPTGSRVTNASDTRRMMQAANDPARVVVSVETNDDVFDAKVSRISGAQVQGAAPHIAAGGAALARHNAGKSQRRRLGTR